MRDGRFELASAWWLCVPRAALLATYGWTDLLPKCTCEFLPDYEDEEEGDGKRKDDGATLSLVPLPTSRGASRRKRPWRYRWPDEIRDEVLARLLKLITERSEEGRIKGLATPRTSDSKPMLAGNNPPPRSAASLLRSNNPSYPVKPNSVQDGPISA